MTKGHSSGPKGLDDSMMPPKLDMKDVDVGGAFQQFLGILKLDKTVINKVANNEKGGASALLFFLVGVVAGPLGFLVFGMKFFNEVIRPDIGFTLQSILIAAVMGAVTFFAISFVANKLFKGKGTFAQYFRVAGLASGLNVLNFVGGLLSGLGSLISLVVAIWLLVIMFVSIKEIFKVDTTNAVLTIIVTVVVVVVVSAVLAAVGLSASPMSLSNSMDLSSMKVVFE